MTEIIKRWVLFTDAQGTTDLADLDFFVRDKAVDELQQFILASDHDAALAAERERGDRFKETTIETGALVCELKTERDQLRAQVDRLGSFEDGWRQIEDALGRSDKERADVDLTHHVPAMQRTIDQLRARVAELEAEIYDANKGDRS